MSGPWWVLIVIILAATVLVLVVETASRRHLHQIQALALSKEAELRSKIDQLNLERDQLSALLSSGTEGLLQINHAGRIVYVNAAAVDLLRLPANARAQPIDTMIRNADLRELLLSAATGKPEEPTELTVDDRQLFVICRPLPEDAGAVAAIIDLTEVRRLEVVRRDFVANVSHELKTPLTSIRGYAETLMADDLPDEMRRQFLDVIQQNAVRIHRIVDDLLDLSRLQSGGWRPDIHDVEVTGLVTDVWASCAETARGRRIEFRVTGPHQAQVAADPGGLRQVFSNLFDNALRYTPPGGRINVKIDEVRNGRSRSPQNRWIEIQVSDTGSGIPRESLPRIFERFYRADPARSRADGGTGLGLSIVKHLIERMNGDVTAESELGKGTTIRIRLPAV
jgi:two-component system phosphate regulon sensor histidine kinase PhoR